MGETPISGSAFHAAKRDTLDDEPLSAEKQNHQRYDVHHTRRHDEIGLPPVHAVEEKHADRQRPKRLALDHDQRPEERTVIPHESENRQRDQRRFRQRQNP